jgi:hypothetical protein
VALYLLSEGEVFWGLPTLTPPPPCWLNSLPQGIGRETHHENVQPLAITGRCMGLCSASNSALAHPARTRRTSTRELGGR